MKLKFFFSLLFSSMIACLTAQTLEPTLENALLEVTVTNMSDQQLPNEIVSFTSIKTKEIYKGYTNENGKFSILVPAGDTYEILYKSIYKDVKYSNLTIPSDDKIYTVNVQLRYHPAKTVILENVEFDFDKASIRPSSYKTLNDLAEVMSIKKNMKIEITGHTDSKGSEEYNKNLSQERAESVRKYLISKGINSSQVIAKGYGSSEAIAPNTNPDGSDNPEGRQRNRRIEVRILD